MDKTIRKPSFGLALAVFLLVIAALAVGMLVFKGKLVLLMLLCWFIVIPAGAYLGYTFLDMEKMAYDMVRTGLGAMMIVLTVGAMIGAWILSGTVPSLIYYGLKIINPMFFFITSFWLCSLTSLFTGTSWGTIGSAGLALIGVGAAMDLNMGIVAASIITGAYFGDKLSPLSDTTNLAATVAGADVMNHVKHMLWTTVPAYIVSSVLYLILGLYHHSANMDYSQINAMLEGLDKIFNLGFIPLLPALLVLILLLLNKPPVASLMVAALLAAVIAIVYQGADVTAALTAMYDGFKIDSGVPAIDKILNRGGVASMWSTMGVFIFALGLGGLLNGVGILEKLLDALTAGATSIKKAVFLTMIVGYVSNAVGASLLFAVAMTGTLMQPLFRKMRLRPENLSRTIEDSATMSAFLIPWNTGALYAAGVLGVASVEFIPYCFLGYITPIFTILYAMTGKTLCKLDPGEEYGETREYKSRFTPAS